MYKFPWLQHASIIKLVSKLNYHHHKFFFVGGCIRDSLLGITPKDFDIVSNFSPQVNINFLSTQNVKVIPYALEYGTIKIIIDNLEFDLTTLRKDIATFGRQAYVEFGGTLQEDAKRRDFTCNALYLDPFTYNIHDFYKGIEDIKNGVIRFIGHPEDRIEEDYLRILRFFRFFSLYSQHDIPDELLNIITLYTPYLKVLSTPRINYEMSIILKSSNYLYTFKIMNETQVLNNIDIALNEVPNKNIIKKVESILSKNNYNLNIFRASLIFNTASKYENIFPETKSIVEINKINVIKDILVHEYPLSFKKICNLIPKYNTTSLVIAVSIEVCKGKIETKLLEYLIKILQEKFPIKAIDLINLGYPTNRDLKNLLDELYLLFLQNPRLCKEDLLSYAKKIKEH